MPYALIVEDDTEIAKFMELVLKEATFELDIVGDGQSALDMMAQIVPDLVLLDLNLPILSGVSVLEKIRADPRLEQVTVIVVSANPHMADQAYDLADIILQKPVSFDQLRSLIARFG